MIRLTFVRVVKKKNTEGFSCLPYILALVNCLLYTWYGLPPVVSNRWENLPVVTVNGVGILFQLSFILTYTCFAPNPTTKVTTTIIDLELIKLQKKVVGMMMGGIGVALSTILVSALGFHDHHRRKIFVGSVGLVASVSMYSSPLVVLKQVIKTKSVEFMPFSLSLFSFLTSSLWMAYGLLSHDLFLASPNIVGCPVGVLQILIYFKYKMKKRMVTEEPVKCDNAGQLMINDN
ncbi:hypothetical protein DM860_010954 [Cuscuta australis]|uniref:Bidirectional sugar transporter SWEET n=2 Tax=Cuscuta sect. Cleistogrammica TaxID=1824901 RepID=A0A328E0F2_9ASTE|nr:hypothetical protein DM860_010954 [Cuscuta australis]